MSAEKQSSTLDASENFAAQQQVIRLQALLEASRLIHSTIALDEVLDTVLGIVVRELELVGAFFTDYPNSYGDVPSEADRTPSNPAFLSFALHDKSGEAFMSLVAILPEGRILTLDENDFLESIAVQSSAAIENARFHKRMVEWQRVESDLAAARQVQRSLLPQTIPNIPGYELAMHSVTCYEVGGDYLDLVSLPDGRVVIVVADVAGKGLVSAMVGASFRSAFRAMVNSGIPLVDVATRMNALHYSEGVESRRRYVTAIFAELSGSSDCIKIVNAGHNPAFLFRPSAGGIEEEKVERIGASGTPIGLVPFSSYREEQYMLAPGSRLFLYTDGLTEVFQGEEEFGEERLLSSLLKFSSAASAEMLRSIWSTLHAFSDGQEQSDDMSAMVLIRQQQGG
jgi:serine phosphatase RsbU (regulator of sigma subunit)